MKIQDIMIKPVKSVFIRILCLFASFSLIPLITYVACSPDINWESIKTITALIIQTILCLCGCFAGVAFTVSAFKLAFQSVTDYTGKKEIVYPDGSSLLLCCGLMILGSFMLLFCSFSIMTAWSL